MNKLEKVKTFIHNQTGAVRNIEIIEPYDASSDNEKTGELLNVCAYCRVSTPDESQKTSHDFQLAEFEEYIKSNPKWKFCGVYSDKGKTGTSKTKRTGFLKMLADCKAGKIDLVVVKSVSRFARNTEDFLFTLRELKNLKSPVGVFFKVEHLNSLSARDEVILTVLATFAQEESHIKSEAMNWSLDHRFANGRYLVSKVFGYSKKKGPFEPLVINEAEAKIVRLCYALFVSGRSSSEVAATLNNLGLKSKKGKLCWSASTVVNLMQNEKYCGDLLVRKTWTPDYLTHRSIKNKGKNRRKKQYYETDHHDAIVPRLVHRAALNLIESHRQGARQHNNPCLSVVDSGALKGFVSVNRSYAGFTAEDYIIASGSAYTEKEEESLYKDYDIEIKKDSVSVFDFSGYSSVSLLLFDQSRKAACTITGKSFTFNSACSKKLNTDYIEILVHPVEKILAIRPCSNDTTGAVKWRKTKSTTTFGTVCFTDALFDILGWNAKLKFRASGVVRTKDNESIILFDLSNVLIIKNDAGALPEKFASSYGNPYYENLTACQLHRIDIQGLWKVLAKSEPSETHVGQILEITEFCNSSLQEFELGETINGQ